MISSLFIFILLLFDNINIKNILIIIDVNIFWFIKDAEERCNGEDRECPPDIYKNSTSICRDKNNTCGILPIFKLLNKIIILIFVVDIAELCNGYDTTCPAIDAFSVLFNFILKHKINYTTLI